MPGSNIDHLRLNPAELTHDSLPAAFAFRSSFFCAQCRPASPPPLTEGVRALAGRHPGLDWRRPGIGVPFAYGGAVRMAGWFPAGARTKAVINPWAWWSVGIHFPGMGYAEWVNTRGPCSGSAKDDVRSVSDTQCAAIFLSLFGPNTVAVTPPPPPAFASASAASSPSPWGRGALHHFRANARLTAALEGFAGDAALSGADAVLGGEAVAALDELRVAEAGWVAEYGGMADEVGVVEDWGMVDVMAGVVGDILEAKRERGLEKWYVVKGVGKRSRRKRRSKGGRMGGWQIAGWGVAVVGVGWVWRRRGVRG